MPDVQAELWWLISIPWEIVVVLEKVDMYCGFLRKISCTLLHYCTNNTKRRMCVSLRRNFREIWYSHMRIFQKIVNITFHSLFASHFTSDSLYSIKSFIYCDPSNWFSTKLPGVQEFKWKWDDGIIQHANEVKGFWSHSFISPSPFSFCNFPFNRKLSRQEMCR